MTSFADLHARLSTTPDHALFIGPPIDIGDLTSAQLGTLWPLLQAAQQGAGIAAPLRAQSAVVLRQAAQRGLPPRLDGTLLLATLQAVPPVGAGTRWLLKQAGYLVAPPAPALLPALETALAPLLPPDEAWPRERLALLAVMRALGTAGLQARLNASVVKHLRDALPAREFAALQGARVPALLALGANPYYDSRSAQAQSLPDPAAMLADDPVYVAFAQAELEAAARRLDRIHAGELPYEADGAFGPDEASVLGLAARVAAHRDAPWYPALIERLLPAACVAPTAARTAPSQALTIALGHAVEGAPTPESVMALRHALEAVRHAGLQKKLARHLKPAERGLAQRPETALRLLDAGLPPKQLRALLAQFFEAGFARPFALPYARWRSLLLGDESAAAFARTLIWQAGTAFMLDGDDRPVDAVGHALEFADDAMVSLWHPVEAQETARVAWRARIGQERIKQPLRQAFRELYQPVDGDIFAGYALVTLRLVGVARSEGWALEYESLVRAFGELRACFALSAEVYPGLDGVVHSGALVFFRGAEPVPMQEVPPRVLSEACRAVDLLVSAAAVALDTEESGETRARGQRLQLLADQQGIDAMRRHAIAQVLQAQIAAGTVILDGFHVCAGGARVSMRTGRVVRDGTPVQLALADGAGRANALRAVPWLPYDEVLLERVVHSVGMLLASGA